MKVTFLGTGTSQGVPVIACHCEVCQSTDTRDKRLRSSILIEAGGKTIVVDTGPDFRQQMLRENVICVDAVLFTHEHKDHTAGLDDVRAFNFTRQLPMDVYSEERVQKSLMSEFPYVFAEKKYPGVPQILLHTISELPFEIEGIKVVPIRTMHHELPILGYRFGEFTYITDTNFISNTEKEKVRGSKYIVVTGLRKKKHLSHFSLSEALQFIDEMKPQRGYITHCSHELGLYSAIQNELPGNVTLAFDGLKIEL